MAKKKKRKPGPGRNPLPKDVALSRKVFFRVEPPFYAKLEAAAKRAGKPLATWIHNTLAELLED